MNKFLNSDMADLTQQLTRLPRRLRMDQIHGIETLLGVVASDKSYPFDFVCYHITKYRKRGSPDSGYSIPGKALISDLVTMGEVLSRTANLSALELKETYRTHQEVAKELDVSTKTIRRWRDRGLMGIHVVYPDGVNRLAFLKRTLDRFADQNKELVAKGSSFKHLTPSERDRIVIRARELRSDHPIKLHAAARVIGEETGRAVETIRYTLRRFDEANPESAIFADHGCPGYCERYSAMDRCRKAGESVAMIARTFDCTIREVESVLRSVQLINWKQLPWNWVHHELFDAPNADAIILDAEEPPAGDGATPRIPRDLPAYLRSLYLTPLLTREQEQDLFRRYNYLKCKVAAALKAVDPVEITKSQFDAISDFVKGVEAVKQRIIAANLRLVVSIARKHVGWSPSFFETISDGNISLMRAVENFDFSRGNKFSTYATWAIVKNYARSIPAQHYHATRYVTGQDEILSTAADQQVEIASPSDRQHIRAAIAAALRELSERERNIVSNHFGLGSKTGSLTLEQLGRQFGVTKERVRQIEQRALGRMRELLAPSLVDALAS